VIIGRKQFVRRDEKGKLKMRSVNIGSKKYTQVFATDEPGAGGANHKYEILHIGENETKPTIAELEALLHSAPSPVRILPTGKVADILGSISFQKGPIKEVGVNGVMNEDLIAMVIDRLQSFQESDYKCRENAVAITKLEEALMWLRKRTQDRENRGVEGTHTV